jgi:hypothetical protein
MTNENDLIQKLMVSKQIMQKHDTMGRGAVRNITNMTPEVEDYQAPSAKYNIPQEYMNESMTMGHTQNDDIDYPLLSESAMTQKNLTKTYKPAPSDRILSSKLPDAIKQLMIEHPIHQPDNPLTGGSTLSDELVEKASRLMNVNANGQQINESKQPRRQQQTPSYSISPEDLKSIVRETVENVLKENGLLVESTKRSNDVFKFSVGQHIFEGKVTKVKKTR